MFSCLTQSQQSGQLYANRLDRVTLAYFLSTRFCSHIALQPTRPSFPKDTAGALPQASFNTLVFHSKNILRRRREEQFVLEPASPTIKNAILHDLFVVKLLQTDDLRIKEDDFVAKMV